MARKIDKPVDPAELAERAERERSARAAEELAVLHPENVIEIAGRTVVVREYTYIEGMRLQGGAAAFLDDLYAAFPPAAGAPAAADVNDLLAKHIFVVQWLIAQAITPLNDADADAFFAEVKANAVWVGQLNDVEGDLLSLAWWGVNRGFFTRRLQRRALAGPAPAGGPSASPSSTPP